MKKRFLAVMMSAVLAVSVLGGCGSKKADSDTAAQTKAADTKEEETSAADTKEAGDEAASGDTVKVGVIQLAEHPALDQSYPVSYTHLSRRKNWHRSVFLWQE